VVRCAAASPSHSPTVSVSPAASADIHKLRPLQRPRGKLVGVVDGESYLTEYVYDSGGNKTQSIRYATRVSFTPWGVDRLASGSQRAGPGHRHPTTPRLNQVASETKLRGTLVQYTYDEWAISPRQ